MTTTGVLPKTVADLLIHRDNGENDQTDITVVWQVGSTTESDYRGWKPLWLWSQDCSRPERACMEVMPDHQSARRD